MNAIQAMVPNHASPHSVERQRPASSIARYVQAAMRHATYQYSASGQPYHGAIAELTGVRSQAATQDGCRAELRAVLETWVLLRLCQQRPVPPIDGIALVAWIGIKQGF